MYGISRNLKGFRMANRRSCEEVVKDLLKARQELEYQCGRGSGYMHTVGFIPKEMDVDIQQGVDAARKKVNELEKELRQNHQ